MTTNGFHIQVVSGRLRPLDRTLPALTGVLANGIDSLQLRDEAASLTAAIQALKHEQAWDRDRMVINGNPRVAGAYGVRWLHLGSEWLDQTPPFAKFARIGISAHTLDEAIEAEAIGADYVTFGHVYSTQSHPGEPGSGVEILAEVVQGLSIPVLAIGGIDHANVGEILATGCAGIAVISAILDHSDPGYATRKMIEAVESSESRPKHILLPMDEPKQHGSSR